MSLIPSLKKDEVNDVLKPVYKDFEKKIGKVPAWVKTMAHSPYITKEFVDFFHVIMGKERAIDKELKWKIGYIVSQKLKCKFCVDVTSKMLLKMGASKDTLEDIEKRENISEDEKKVFDLVEDITEDGHLDNPEIFDELKQIFSKREIVEIISVIGFFNYINRFNNTLAILPE